MNFVRGLSFGSSNDDETGPASTTPKDSYATANDIDLDAFTHESVRILRERHTGEDGVTTWKLISDDGDDGGRIWRGSVKDCAWSPFRVSRRIDASKSEIENALLDPDSLMKLDEMMASVKVLREKEGSNGRITLRHVLAKGVFPTSPREFVLVTSAVDLEDGTTAIASRSVDLTDVPVPDGHVRGNNLISGYLITEKKDSHGRIYCDVVLIGHADLSGYIPATVINMLGTSATMKILVSIQNQIGTPAK